MQFSWKKGLTRIRLFAKSVLFWHICLNKSLVKVKNTCFSGFPTKSTKERRGLTLGLLSIVPKGQKTPTIWRTPFRPFWTDFGEIKKSEKGVFFVRKMGVKSSLGRLGRFWRQRTSKRKAERRGLTHDLLSIVGKGQKTPTIWRACLGPPKRSKNGASSGELRRKRMILHPS